VRLSSVLFFAKKKGIAAGVPFGQGPKVI